MNEFIGEFDRPYEEVAYMEMTKKGGSLDRRFPDLRKRYGEYGLKVVAWENLKITRDVEDGVPGRAKLFVKKNKKAIQNALSNNGDIQGIVGAFYTSELHNKVHKEHMNHFLRVIEKGEEEIYTISKSIAGKGSDENCILYYYYAMKYKRIKENNYLLDAKLANRCPHGKLAVEKILREEIFRAIKTYILDK